MFSVVEDSGQGLAPRPYYIRAPSTTTNEDPGVYSDHSQILNATTGAFEAVYFGTKTIGIVDLEKTDSNPAIAAVFVLIFGNEDTNGNGTYQASDQPYSQNLAFQAIRLS